MSSDYCYLIFDNSAFHKFSDLMQKYTHTIFLRNKKKDRRYKFVQEKNFLKGLKKIKGDSGQFLVT